MTGSENISPGAAGLRRRPLLAATLLAPVACVIGLLMIFAIALNPTNTDDIVTTSSPLLRVIPVSMLVVLASLAVSFVARKRSPLIARRFAWVSSFVSATLLLTFVWMLA